MDQTAPAPAPAETAGTNPLEVFAQNLLIDKGFMDLSPELIADMKADLLQRLELLSTQVMLEALNETDIAEFERLVDSGATPDQLQQYSESKVPDYAQRLTEALLRFRITYLGTAA